MFHFSATCRMNKLSKVQINQRDKKKKRDSDNLNQHKSPTI